MQNLGVGMALQWMVKPFLGVLVARTAASVWNLEPGIATGLILVSRGCFGGITAACEGAIGRARWCVGVWQHVIW